MVGTLALPGDIVIHPFLWDDGKLIDLGTFGGSYGQPNWINDAGKTVGWAYFADDITERAALWTNGQMHDLGALPGQECSAANAINSKGQIVGDSTPCDVFQPTAVLWEHGSIVDLNSLIPSNSNLHLEGAHAISDRGEIECGGILPNGDSHVILLIPCGDGDQGCDDSVSVPAAQRPPTATPSSPALDGRGMLDRLRGRRFPDFRIPGPATRPTN